ncbi:MAG: ABC transporter ATP-binding protein [Eubacteriales bacterium]|nr:ABC transporter ATP-binding protein [Eubacteriales bacterium]
MLKILKYLSKKEWLYIGVSIVFIIGQVWLDLKLPDYMSAITTLVQTEGSAMSDILTQGGYMLLCALGSMAFSVIVGYFAAKTAAGLAKTLRGNVFDKTIGFSLEEIDRFSTASLINRSTNDITQIQNVVAMGLQMIVKAPIMAVWAIVKIAGKNYWQWTATTAVSVFILIVVLAITLIFAMPRFKKIQGLTDNLNRVTREHLTGIRVVRAYNAEQYQEDKFAKANDEVTVTNMTANRVMALMSPTMTLISSGLTLVVYWIGAYIIEAAGMDAKLGIFSDMVVFSNYAIQVIQAFMMLNMIFIMMPRAQVSARRICEVLDTESRIHDGKKTASAAQGTVEFRDVSFRYPGAAADTLHNISFTAQKGETVALIGATGCGKTTLINLIPRFYDVSQGQVLVDGQDVRDYTQEALHNRIGYVSQKAVLFSGTVTSNIAFGENGKEAIGAQGVEEAVSIAQAAEFVEKMEGTYDAPIAQGGTNVSGGQKQRLSIARAVARKPEILIFDDSFSALDYKTDRTLRSVLHQKTADTTKMIVAQRISTIKDADRILVLDHGRIVGKGTHAELLKNCPEYLEIAQSQLSKEEIENG